MAAARRRLKSPDHLPDPGANDPPLRFVTALRSGFLQHFRPLALWHDVCISIAISCGRAVRRIRLDGGRSPPCIEAVRLQGGNQFGGHHEKFLGNPNRHGVRRRYAAGRRGRAVPKYPQARHLVHGGTTARGCNDGKMGIRGAESVSARSAGGAKLRRNDTTGAAQQAPECGTRKAGHRCGSVQPAWARIAHSGTNRGAERAQPVPRAQMNPEASARCSAVAG